MARYYKKLKDADLDCCPYQFPSDSWKNDPTKWPDLDFPDIYVYLIEAPGVFTRESMKNRKSLEAHNQFISGWVRTIYHYQKIGSNFMILKAEVIPSQRLNENPHLPWVAINLKGTSVETPYCTCMAGLGASCSHIVALLFKSETAVKAGFTKKAGFTLVGEDWGIPYTTPKIGLSPPCPPTALTQNADFLISMQFLAILPKLSPSPVDPIWGTLESLY